MTLRCKGISTIIALVLVLVALTTAAWAATSQIKGGSYTGALQPASRGIQISFKVSGNGSEVTDLRSSNVPLYCSGGGPPIPTHFKNARISAQGAFTSTALDIIKVGPYKGQVGERLKITGKFLKGGVEQGTLTTSYSKAPSCGGKSSYSTKT